jgi:hypothetical protein
LLDVLACARLSGREPDRIAVVGLTPGDIDVRVGLTPGVAAAVPLAVTLAQQVLAAWWDADDAHAESLAVETGAQR